jgi:cytochrome c biogenesis protein CcmG/thiol:disulfide interchange protein DsbE
MTTFDGQQVHTADYKGKVVVLNFWASWCGPCADEAPVLQQAWGDLQPTGKVVFIGVDYLDSDIKALPYLKQYGVTYPNGPDLRTSISSIFRISGVPETYIIGPDGRLAFVKVGPFTSAQDVVQLVNLYLPQE